SSRRRHTRCLSDWSSDVCSSDLGAVLVQALTAARETLSRDREGEDAPTIVQQQADALALLAETALHRGIDPGVPAERYQVVVHEIGRASCRERGESCVGGR